MSDQQNHRSKAPLVGPGKLFSASRNKEAGILLTVPINDFTPKTREERDQLKRSGKHLLVGGALGSLAGAALGYKLTRKPNLKAIRDASINESKRRWAWARAHTVPDGIHESWADFYTGLAKNEYSSNRQNNTLTGLGAGLIGGAAAGASLGSMKRPQKTESAVKKASSTSTPISRPAVLRAGDAEKLRSQGFTTRPFTPEEAAAFWKAWAAQQPSTPRPGNTNSGPLAGAVPKKEASFDEITSRLLANLKVASDDTGDPEKVIASPQDVRRKRLAELLRKRDHTATATGSADPNPPRSST